MQREILKNREQLDNYHLNKLRRLLTDLEAHNLFYKEKLHRADVSSSISNLKDFTEKMPFTTKAELLRDQATSPPYGTNFTHPLDSYTRFHQTSATTGVPLRWLDTPLDWDWILENWMLIFDIAGVESTDRIFFPFSFGPFLGFWAAFEAACKMGCLCIPGGGLRSMCRLQMILDNEINVMCCTPSYALRLGIVAEREKIDLSKSTIRTIIVAGEPGGCIPATRDRIEEMWNGCAVFDHHGMTEVGPVSFQCTESPTRLHVIETSYFPEVINPKSGAPVDAGECGELVLTTLGRNGSPLLRYKTNDWVKLSAVGSCGCGKAAMALDGGILGRVDDMIVVNGTNIYPSAIEGIVREIGAIGEYQVKISTDRGLRQLEIVIEVKDDSGDNQAICDKLENLIQSITSLRIPVSIVPDGTIVRDGMKAKRWVFL